MFGESVPWKATFLVITKFIQISYGTTKGARGWLVISVYSWSLSVTHLSDAQRRRLVVTGDSARIQDETTESSDWYFNLLATWDFCLKSLPKDN